MSSLRIRSRFRDLKDVVFGTPVDGDVATYDLATNKVIMAAPAAGGVTDHGALTGLADDDHPQYTTSAELLAAIAAALAGADGAGLSDNGAGVLAVNVDGTTIEISGDALRVVAGVFAAAAHAHAGEDITSGTVALARLPGTVATDTEVTNAVAAEASARDAAIAAAVAALIDSSPGLLDTLNELAAALGDDPNFAATIASALAGKQPLDSDLTDIAALATTAFGRSLLELANAAALLAAAGGAAATLTLTAGDGLSGGGDLSANRTFTVNVDGATIEISADALRVKALGIDTAHLADGAVTPDKVDADQTGADGKWLRLSTGAFVYATPTAAEIPFTPAGSIAATDVQAAIEEVASEAGGTVPTDGWTDDTANTWTRTADQTFTVSGDRTAVFPKGTRLKWTQTTVKYGVVRAVSHAAGTTTVTIATTTDYVLTAAAITDNYFSYQTNPQGYPAYFNYTPSWTSSGSAPSIGDGSLAGRFQLYGDLCVVSARYVNGSTTVEGTGTYTFGMPMQEADIGGSAYPGFAWAFDVSGGASHPGFWRAGNVVQLATVPATFWSNTIPFTWATGDTAEFRHSFRI